MSSLLNLFFPPISISGLDEIRDYDQHCGVHEGTMDRTPERDSDNQLMSVAVGTNAPTSRIDFEEDNHFPVTDLQESGYSAELRDSPAATLALDDNPTASSSSVAAPTVDQVSRAQKLDPKERSIWFGTGTKTVDTDLEEQILMLKETQIKYTELLKLAKQMMQHSRE